MTPPTSTYRLALVGFLLAPAAAESEITVLGPTPYLSAADSPFADYLGGPDFYLEDFEDGELNTPGIFQPIISPVFGTGSFGTVVGPGPSTDSVDGDGDAIDGFGTDGHSLRSNLLVIGPMVPQLNQVSIVFEFESTTSTPLPNAFGVVWTDGPQGVEFRDGLTLVLSAIDIDGELHQAGADIIEDEFRTGQTEEDFFLGLTSSIPLTRVTVRANFFGEGIAEPYIEIDHVQYGLVVPETNLIAMTVVILISGCLSGRRHKRIAGVVT